MQITKPNPRPWVHKWRASKTAFGHFHSCPWPSAKQQRQTKSNTTLNHWARWGLYCPFHKHLGGCHHKGQRQKKAEAKAQKKATVSNGSEGSRARFGALQRGKIAWKWPGLIHRIRNQRVPKKIATVPFGRFSVHSFMILSFSPPVELPFLNGNLPLK